MNHVNSKTGFTLIELIIVIAILGILAGTAIPVYSGYVRKADEAADAHVLEAVYSAAALAAVNEGGITSITVEVDGDKNVSTITVKSEKIAVGYVYAYNAAEEGRSANWACTTANHGNGKCPADDFSAYIGTAPLRLSHDYTWSGGAWS